MNEELRAGEDELMPRVLEQLDGGGKVSFLPKGDDMRPMLRDGDDMVFLEKPGGRLHLFDLSLYYDRSVNAYVLSRVVDFKRDGSYVMLGDNCVTKVRGVTDDDVAGVETSFYRKGRMYTTTHPIYRLYCNLWYYTSPIRRLYYSFRSRSGSGKENED